MTDRETLARRLREVYVRDPSDNPWLAVADEAIAALAAPEPPRAQREPRT